MPEAERVHLDVALELGGDPIRGTVADGTYDAVEFSGWLELMSAVERVRARAVAVSHPADDDV